MTPTISIAHQLRAHAASRAYELALAKHIRRRVAENVAGRLGALQTERKRLVSACNRIEAALQYHTARAAGARRAYEDDIPFGGNAGRIARPPLVRRVLTFGAAERRFRQLGMWIYYRDEIAADLNSHRQRAAVVSSRINELLEREEVRVGAVLSTAGGLNAALRSDPQLALAHARVTALAGHESNSC